MANAKRKAEEHAGKHIVRNIIIGVVTSVIGALIIFFVIPDNTLKKDFEKRKKATISAWDSYLKNKDIFGRTLINLGEDTSETKTVASMKADANHEFDITISNLENIKKTPDADPKVFSAVDILSDQIKSFRPLLNSTLDDIVKFGETTSDTAEIRKFGEIRSDEMSKQYDNIKKRDSLRLQTIISDLKKEYKYEFVESLETEE